MVKNTGIRKRKETGCILWENRSIVCIAIYHRSQNRKTGAMVQTYIILKNIDPRDAIKNGMDRKICGTCIHRLRWDEILQKWVRTCYVNIGQGVCQVYKAYKKGNYSQYNPETHNPKFAGKMLRIGTYGDPAVLPYEVWEKFLPLFDGHTGYTHQAETADPRFSKILMASSDSLEDTKFANSKGYRAFVVIPHNVTLAKKNEHDAILCVNTSHQKKCEDCGLCNGNPNDSGRNIFIQAHGPSKRFVMSLN